MMEAQNTPKDEHFICKHCKKYGGWLETHDVCEANYINNFRQTDCQCDNIGHGWNVTSNNTLSDEDFQEYYDVNNALPEPTLEKLDERFSDVRHQDPDRIDLITARSIKKHNWETERESGVILFWNGKIYDSKNAISIIKEETEEQIRECNRADKLEVIDKIKSLTYTEISDFDSDPNIMTLENGVFNITTQQRTDHTPTNLSKVLIPCRFIEGVTDISETKFWKYLISTCTVNGKLDEDMSDDILELMASCFVKRQIDEKSFILLGNGDNGKSVLLLYLNSMLGKDNVSNISLQTLADDKFQVASLDGKMANIFTDIEEHELKKTGIIKAISSGEPVSVRHLYGEPFDMYPYAKLIFSCNRFPKVYDQSDGFFRRWIIIEFKRKFALGDPDRIEGLKYLLMNDQAEKDLVFSYLMLIAKKLLRTGKFQYSLSYNQIRKLWNANADPLNDFVENYIKDGTSWKGKRETYVFYKNVMLDNGLLPLNYRAFNKAFSEYFDENHSGSVRSWLNIDFKVPKQEKMFKESDNVFGKTVEW